jgi:hypothetical protein
MNAKDVFLKLNQADIYQQRKITDDYAEAVLFSKGILLCSEIMQGLLGDPISPAGIQPNDKAIELTKDFGGIAEDQTLFAKEIEGVCIMVMFWPWQDGEHTTVKIICSGEKNN